VRWRLDRQAGTATLEDAPAALRDYRVPMRPMLGGLGVAPDFGFAPFSAGDSGRFGGNMDYNGIVEGTTIYLPVFQPGALLYLGDGHALQADGETTQWALETSLDVEFSVDILPPAPLATPRIESADAIATLGQAGSLDEAVRQATAGMVQWLAQAHGLDDRESSLLIGTAAELRIATLAGRNAGVALRLPKTALDMLASTGRNSAGQ
jgi:acetamidase/formamidase